MANKNVHKPPPVGIGGWLSFFFWINVLLAVAAIGQSYAELTNLERSGQIDNVQFESFKFWYLFAVWGGVAAIAYMLFILRKHVGVPGTPKTIIYLIWLSGIGPSLIVLAAAFVNFNVANIETIAVVVKGGIFAAIWTWYFLVSKRVKNTYNRSLSMNNIIVSKAVPDHD